MQPTEAIFRSIVDISPFPVYMCTGEDAIVAVANAATLKAWGRDKSVIGKPFAEALPEMHDQPFLGLIKQVYKTGIAYHTDNDRADLLINGKIETFYYKFTYTPVLDDAGQTYGVACFATDVTEQERAKQNSEESELTLNNLVRQAPVGICIVGAHDLNIQVVNDSYLELVGKKRKEMENRTIWHAVPEAAESYAPILNSVIETGVPFVATEHELILIRNGKPETVFVDFVYEPVRYFDGTINNIMVIAIEVTEKVKARRNIEDAEERGRLAIEAAEIGTFDLDVATGVMVSSDRFNAIMGFESTVSREKYVDVIHPEDRALRALAHENAFKNGILFYEARVIHPDDSIHWMRAQGKVYFDSDKKPFRLLGTVLDITEFKRLQQQKDDFISVASHELKTPMTSLKASIQILEKIIKAGSNPDKVPVFIDKANTSLIKMQHLIESLLNVSRITAGQLGLVKTHFNAAEMVNECCDHIGMNGQHQVTITGNTDLKIYADRGKIEQVVINLVNNAVKYAPDSDKIIINITTKGKMAKFSVQDFGDGIPSDKIPHLFERYYRVDSNGLQYSGLGLGLYISAEIVERHGGKIGVNSEATKGSTFWFTVPIGD